MNFVQKRICGDSNLPLTVVMFYFLKGFVSVLKEGFGFIETEEHDCELFFPFRFVILVLHVTLVNN